MKSCSRFDLAQKFSHKPDMHQHLFKLWEDFQINQPYQNMFLTYLDQLTLNEAQKIISKELKLLYQKKSLYFVLQENLDLRNQILQQLVSFVDETQNLNLQQQRLSQICDKINNLRKINLLTSQTVLKILSQFYLQPDNPSIFVAKQYIQIFNKINQENIGLKQSFLNQYILFQNGFDPFFLTHYQLLMRSNKPEYRKSRAVEKLFTLNISYAYRLLRAQNKMISYLSKTNVDIQVPNGQLTPHLNKKKVKGIKEPQSFQKQIKYQYNQYFDQNYPKRSDISKVHKNIAQTLKTNTILKFPKINQKSSLQESASTSKIYSNKKPQKHANYYPIILQQSQKNNNNHSAAKDHSAANNHSTANNHSAAHKKRKSLQKYALQSQQSDDEAFDIQKNLINKKQIKQRYSLDNKQTDRRKNNYKSSFFGTRFQTQIESIQSQNNIFRNSSIHKTKILANRIKQKQRKTPYLRESIINQNKIIKQRLNSQLQNESNMSLKQKIWNKKDLLKKSNNSLNLNSISPINKNKKPPQIEQQQYYKGKSKAKLNLQTAFNYNFSYHPQNKNEYNSPNNNQLNKNYFKNSNSSGIKTDRYQTNTFQKNKTSQLNNKNTSLEKNSLNNNVPNMKSKYINQNNRNEQEQQTKNPILKQHSDKYKKNERQKNKLQKSGHSQNDKGESQNDKGESQNDKGESQNDKRSDFQESNLNSDKIGKTNEKQQLKKLQKNRQNGQQPNIIQNQLKKQQKNKLKQIGIKSKLPQNQIKNKVQIKSAQTKQKNGQIKQKNGQIKQKNGQTNEKNAQTKQKNAETNEKKVQTKQKNAETNEKKDKQKSQLSQIQSPKNSSKFKSLSLKNKIQPNEDEKKSQLKNPVQASSKIKQIKMKPGKLQYSQLDLYLTNKIFLKGYNEIIKQSIASIKKIAQNTQTYLMEFFINDQVVLVALCAPTTIGDIIIYLWGPIAQKCTDKSSIFFFNKYIQYLQKNTTSKSIFYKGGQISQVRSNNFEKVKQKLYSRKRVTPITRQSFQFQPFLSFQISNIFFQLVNSEPILYSQQIQPFSDTNSFIVQILVQNPQKNAANIKSQIIFNQNIKSLQEVNSILEKDSYDTYEIGPQIKAQGVNLSRMMLQAGPKSGFICHQGYIIAIGNYFTNQKQQKQIFRVQMTKNVNMYFSKAFKKVSQMYKTIIQQKQKKYSQQVQFAFKMFSKQLYGQLKFRNNKQTHYYGNWDINFAWRDQILGKLGRIIPKDFRFGPQSFFTIIQLNGIMLFGLQVNQNDFLS